MYAAEAMWLSFSTDGYPWALKIAAGMINAVSGEGWTMNLHSRAGDPSRERDEASSGRGQDYVVLPEQPWLDGFNTGDDSIRQFVAMPLGGGFTAEEQLTGQAIFGGLQTPRLSDEGVGVREAAAVVAGAAELEPRSSDGRLMAAAPPDMGLGAGGRITQDITEDPYGVDSWDLDHPSRCFVHLARAEQWPALTGRATPTKPPTAKDYLENGLPWFDYAAQGSAVPAADPLASLRSVHEHAAQNGLEITDNDSIPIDRVVRLGRRGGRRQWAAPGETTAQCRWCGGPSTPTSGGTAASSWTSSLLHVPGGAPADRHDRRRSGRLCAG